LHEPLREDEYPDKDLHFMQVVGVEEKLRTHVRETIEKLKKMNLWLLSGDSNNRVIPVAYRSGILDPNENSIHIDDTQSQEINLIIKNQLNLMNNQLKSIVQKA
jgi:magnesium-transporting ATPase (P-type)